MTHQNFIKKNAKSGIKVKIFTNFREPCLKGGGWMVPLDILNTAGSSPPTPTNFRAVQDPQRRNSFTAGASVYGPLLEIQA